MWEILKNAGTHPTPRRADPTWPQFLRSQAEAILACDFFTADLLDGTQAYVLAVIEHATRPMWPAPRSSAAGQPTPTRAEIPRTGGSRRPSAPPARTSRLLPARSKTPAAWPNRRLVSRGPAATLRTPPLSSPSPGAARVFAGDAPGAVPLASEALALARQIRAPALIASGLLAVGLAVADTDPGQSRASLRESSELSTALGYQNDLGLLWATGIAYRINDQAATLELGRRAIRGLRWGGDRLRMGLVLHMIAGALATARPASAATIQGAAETNVVAPPSMIAPIALGDERVRELRARGADMDWDQAVAYTITQALNDLGSQTQP